MTTQRCPDCGAIWQDDETCETYFHQMLFWENDDPRNGVVHHLMVLAYHIQHPGKYSPEGLRYSIDLLNEFVEKETPPAYIRQRMRDEVNSGKREWRVTGGGGAHGRPIPWTMTAADVIAGGIDAYIENVTAWARSIHASLQIE